MKLKHLILLSVICCSQSVFGQKANQQPKTSGNPVFPGWYADPEGIVFGDEYWIYPTYSAPYDEQTFMDAFSSKDLVNWTKHPKVLSKEKSTCQDEKFFFEETSYQFQGKKLIKI